MKYIYVLEDDPKMQQQLYEGLRLTEPQAQIRFFSSLEKFQKWMMLVVKDGQKALCLGGEIGAADPGIVVNSWDPSDELLLLISKDEWLGSRYVKLIKKTIETFIRKSICTKEDQTRIVITAFEGPDFDFKLVEDKVISNVIFKPFDVLILQQHLHFALKGHHPPSQSFVHKVQTAQEVEMTKEAQIEAVGDVGFVSRSPREIKIGQIAKYYGDVFKGTGRTHIMARCIACEPHPDFPSEFRIWFSYFGIPNMQISDIRKSMVKRNEIEYSANSPWKPQPLEQEWVILDPNKERVAKFNKILENTTKANIKVFSSFDHFFFQSDPNAMENARKEKAWTDVEKITLRLDIKCEKILKIFPEEQGKKKIFGEPYAEFVKLGFHSKLHEVSATTLKHWIVAGTADPNLIVVQNQGNFFTLKVTSFAKKTEGAESFFEMELSEPTIVERMKWFTEKFPSPQKAYGILIAEEYLYEEKLGYWEEFVTAAKANGPGPRYFGLFKKDLDEKFARKLNWVEDIFENANDSSYVEKKFRWRNGQVQSPKTSEHQIFLNSCKEIIRVANPVSIAELSEAGLVINYHRSLDRGVFRKFVLSKSAESFIEYLANCNFSAEHPTEKNMFQSHFVFFGITDVHLKSIRVWILENYVHSKQEEGA
jgi:hypothetical protein